MNNPLFDAASIREDIDTEAKRATGRDGRGALPDTIWATYSSFANTEGGIIFLGVEEREDGTFHPVGIAEPDRVLNDLWAQLGNPQKVSHNLLTDASVRCYVTDTGRWVLEIEVPRAARKLRPVFINGNPLMVSDGRGRGSSYRISGEELLDLDSSTHLPGRSTHLEPSSTHLPGSSTHLELSSTHLPGSSTHLDMTSTHLPVENDMSDDAMLIMIADEVRGKGKASKDAIRRTLLALCRGSFLTPQQLGKLLLRTPHGLRERFIKPMLEEHLLERRFPQLPNHEQQAYRAKESDSE